MKQQNSFVKYINIGLLLTAIILLGACREKQEPVKTEVEGYTSATAIVNALEKRIEAHPDQMTQELKRKLQKLIEKRPDSVKGLVVNENGKGLPGVNIFNKYNHQKAYTDFNGNFKIKASNGDVLMVNYIGLNGEEITIGNDTIYKIVMRQ